jgi:hypothetical protein
MKTNKAVVTLLVVSALWLALVLGCSYLKKGTMSPSSSWRSVVNRFKRLLSPERRRFMEVSIYHRGRQTI